MSYHSPTVDVFGSYFPAWIMCILLGIVITIIFRLLLAGMGINEHLRAKLVIYPCAAVFFTLVTWLIFFKN